MKTKIHRFKTKVVVISLLLLLSASATRAAFTTTVLFDTAVTDNQDFTSVYPDFSNSIQHGAGTDYGNADG